MILSIHPDTPKLYYSHLNLTQTTIFLTNFHDSKTSLTLNHSRARAIQKVTTLVTPHERRFAGLFMRCHISQIRT